MGVVPVRKTLTAQEAIARLLPEPCVCHTSSHTNAACSTMDSVKGLFVIAAAVSFVVFGKAAP